MDTIERISRPSSFHHALEIEGILLTMYDDRTNLTRQVAADLTGFFGEQVFKTIIPRSIRSWPKPRVSARPFWGTTRDPAACRNYIKLAKEILDHEQNGQLPQKALGRGMGALLPTRPLVSQPAPPPPPTGPPPPDPVVQSLPVDAIDPNPLQPRRHLQERTPQRTRRIPFGPPASSSPW